MSSLVWSPVYKVLEERLRMGDELVLIVVPFVKLEALRQLQWAQPRDRKLKVVCRWAPGDLVSGVSDLEVFTYLTNRGCELYITPDIHLKLYIFASNVALNTSGNLTLRGLGYADESNIEVGNLVQLVHGDWVRLWRIIAASRQVDEALYHRFKVYIDTQQAREVLPPLSSARLDIAGPSKAFTIASLPATDTPLKLIEYYSAPRSDAYSSEEIRRATHDLITFAIPDSLAPSEFELVLGESFRSTPFVQSFVSELQARGSLGFGAVTHWIHSKCEDVPLPYRWEVKENTAILFDWLVHFYHPRISWRIPGRHAQVIYWHEAGSVSDARQT